ncbi:MAG: flagellar basal body rod protein FlgC [Dehalococcoidia bacterium]|nr:flagellar basal body rod protein FlgC [Dehalococcoidia bacterium]
MGLIGAIASTASGLQAQRVRMDVVSANVANIDTTRDASGGPYQRKIVRFTAAGQGAPFAHLVSRLSGQPAGGVVLTQVATDQATPNRLVYDPSHIDADADGYVELSNVNLVTEMTDLASANRSYQANVTVLNAMKQMALRALDIASR